MVCKAGQQMYEQHYFDKQQISTHLSTRHLAATYFHGKVHSIENAFEHKYYGKFIMIIYNTYYAALCCGCNASVSRLQTIFTTMIVMLLLLLQWTG